MGGTDSFETMLVGKRRTPDLLIFAVVVIIVDVQCSFTVFSGFTARKKTAVTAKSNDCSTRLEQLWRALLSRCS